MSTSATDASHSEVFAQGAAALKDIICTHELETRPSSSPDHESENLALKEISRQLSQSPRLALKALAVEAMRLTSADAAGISIAEIDENGAEIFRWHAASGSMEKYLNATMPLRFSPCGEVCLKAETILVREPVKHYAYVSQLEVNLFEVLLVPFFQEGKAIGTVWAISEGPHKIFSSENKRVLESLAHFTSGIVQSYLQVNEMEKINHTLSTLVEELEEEREARERFVCALSHDLKNPLTSVKIQAAILSRQLKDNPAALLGLSKLGKGIDKAALMIDDLLDANKLSAGEGIPLTLTAFEMESLISDTLSNLSEIHGVKIIFENEAGSVIGKWDLSAVRRAIENLVENAIKYGDNEKCVIVALSKSETQTTISVTNFGNPIALNDQKDLFKQYRRTESAIASGQKGWGIGLALVQGIVEAHRGQVNVRSNVEQGTTFSVHLPL